VQAAEAEGFVNQASLWEMAIKESLGRLAVASLDPVDKHRDPFDRQLQCYGATVVLV
jgi:PIN domain nuclease of toxin-antitoxin system